MKKIMKKIMQKVSIWLFRKSFNLHRVQADRLTNTKTLKMKGEKKNGKI